MCTGGALNVSFLSLAAFNKKKTTTTNEDNTFRVTKKTAKCFHSSNCLTAIITAYFHFTKPLSLVV